MNELTEQIEHALKAQEQIDKLLSLLEKEQEIVSDLTEALMRANGCATRGNRPRNFVLKPNLSPK